MPSLSAVQSDSEIDFVLGRRGSLAAEEHADSTATMPKSSQQQNSQRARRMFMAYIV